MPSRKGHIMLAAALLCAAAPAMAAEDPAQRWWGMVEALADDSMEGRGTGTPGYDRAADLVVRELRRLGLKPAGTHGFFQPVPLVAQRFDPAASRAALVAPGGETASLAVPQDIHFRGAHTMPETVDAPLIFAGYGLSIPSAGHDDFAGLDVRGKIVVVMAGGPTSLSGAAKANARSARARLLADRGALGMIALTTPRQIEIPWTRQVALSARASMYFADAALRDVPVPFVSASVDPARAEALFAGSGHSFADLAALADAAKPLPRLALPLRFTATISTSKTPVTGKNLLARLPGSSRVAAAEHVVLSAHLDGLGIGEAMDGDAIYNGAFDNAVGVAGVIEIARALKAQRPRPRRSILFAIYTAEEMGLLGSRYFALRPTVAKSSLVANINFDMPLPIFPLRSVTPIGYEESTLGDDARAVGAETGLPIVPDPFPDRNVFIRSDQYSLIREGVPALFLKYGFAAGTPEAAVERAWRANIYHSPRDDARQPVMKDEALRLNAYAAALVRRIANNPQRPQWHADSLFNPQKRPD